MALHRIINLTSPIKIMSNSSFSVKSRKITVAVRARQFNRLLKLEQWVRKKLFALKQLRNKTYVIKRNESTKNVAVKKERNFPGVWYRNLKIRSGWEGYNSLEGQQKKRLGGYRDASTFNDV